MTSIQSQQAQRADDHAARTSRRAGKPVQGQLAPDAGAQFSGMVADSQRKLEADRLASMKDSGAMESHSKKRIDAFDEDGSGDDGITAPVAQGARDNGEGARQTAQSTGPAPSMAHAQQIRTASEDSPDLLHLASLLPAGADDGLFEVLMPNRAKVGVSVSDLPAGLSYLLMPEDDVLADRLRGHEMELEAMLKRRIRRNVKVVVL